jgi:hypothetical protein
MAETLAAAILAVRTRLDEQSVRQWEDAYIRRWLWEGEQETARRTHCLKEFRDISMTAADNEYTLPADVLEVKDALWLPGGGDTREIPLEGRPWDVLSRYWGMYPTQVGTPQVWTVRGRAPSVTIRTYPAPYQNSTLRIYAAVLPANFDFSSNALDTSRTIQVPDGFTDLPINYATAMAMLMDKDNGGYQTYRAMFDMGIDNLTANDEYANFASEFIPVNGRFLARDMMDW